MVSVLAVQLCGMPAACQFFRVWTSAAVKRGPPAGIEPDWVTLMIVVIEVLAPL